jgi:hypothetical protein
MFINLEKDKGSATKERQSHGGRIGRRYGVYFLEATAGS